MQGQVQTCLELWLIFLVSIDPAASPESISSRRVKISPIESPDLRQGGIHSNLFKQRKAVSSDLYSNLFQAERGQHKESPPPPPPRPHTSQGGSWWSRGSGGGGSRGPVVGEWEGRRASFPAAPAWQESSVVDLVFAKYKATRSEPLSEPLSQHRDLCQACAHPLCWCQGGGWAGCLDTVAPAGLRVCVYTHVGDCGCGDSQAVSWSCLDSGRTGT